MIRAIQRLLNDAVLGFLALVSLFLVFTPSVFPLTASGLATLALIEQAIIVLFAVEYIAAFIAADRKRGFLLNWWRLLDALIIAAGLAALFPAGPEFLRSSPVLRLARLGRVALLGTRSGLALTSNREGPGRRSSRASKRIFWGSKSSSRLLRTRLSSSEAST